MIGLIRSHSLYREVKPLSYLCSGWAFSGLLKDEEMGGGEAWVIGRKAPLPKSNLSHISCKDQISFP